ncbi:MAG: TAXI family TRAP transporter solute-binding subunit [Desulfatitalea sp.]
MLLLIVLWVAFQTACGGDAKVETGSTAPTATVANNTTTFVTIGTGAVDGIYEAFGQAIASMVNRKQARHGIHLTVESTGGAVFNVNAVMAGDLQFGLTRSDRNHQAFKGLAHWKERGAQKELRSIFSLPSAAVDANITAIQSNPDTLGDAGTERFGSMTTLITSAKVPESIVYVVTKAVFENFEALKDLHPAYSGLTQKGMLEGLSAPIHPGALKYYQEAGVK